MLKSDPKGQKEKEKKKRLILLILYHIVQIVFTHSGSISFYNFLPCFGCLFIQYERKPKD